MTLTASAVGRRVATSVLVAAAVILGLYGLWRLPVNFLPDMTYPLIKVHIWWPGATPEEIDRNLADPIERQMATVDGLDYLESSAIEGMYTLQANFRYGRDIDVAYQDALAAMARVARSLPKDMEPPVVIKADPSQLPVVQLTVSSDQLDLVRLRTWTEDFLQDQLLAVPGVAGAEIVGGLEREIRVHVDPQALEKYGLSLPAVVERIGRENVERFGGRVTVGPREFIARTVGEYRSLDDLRNVVLTREGEAKVHLRDVARVEDAHAEARVITRLGGEPCVKVSVLKQADANTVEVARAVAQKIAELRPGLPGGIQLGMVENQADYVEAALRGVRNTALEAAVLVILTVYLFLGSWRQVAAMVLALPITLLANFGLMKLAGFSLNIFSLGGLVVAIGVVLDNSIVVLENISRLRQERPETPAGVLAVEGTAEVGPAIVAATLSFLALFAPFLMVPGLTILLFRELILVVGGIVLVSLVVAVTVTPMLAALLLGSGQTHRERTVFERLFERLTAVYGRVLDAALRWRWVSLGVFACVVAGAALLFPHLGGEFLPRMDDGRVMVKVKLPTGASVGQTDKILRRIEVALGGDPAVQSLFTLVGGKVWGLYTYEIANEGEVDIQLVPRSERRETTAQYIRRIRPLVAKIPVPGGKAMVMPMKVKGLRKLGDAEIEVEIRGQDVATLFGLAHKTAGTMNELGHLTNVHVSLDMSKPEYQLRIDRTRAAELGVSVADVATALRTLIRGTVATQFREGQEYYDVRVMVPERELTSRHSVENLLLNRAGGGSVRLGDLAAVVTATGPVEIIRRDQVKQVVVRADTRGVSVGEALTGLQGALERLDVPAGYALSFGGQAKMMADMRTDLLGVLAFAALFSFVVLAVQFNSLRLPALLLTAVPVSLAGLVFGLWVTGLPLGSTVLIGVLVVMAATVNEGVLLLTYAEELRREGATAIAAVAQASRIRFRPRMMISFMIITGFLPLALSLEEGGEMLQPMAAGAIGGLAFGVPVALFLVPCLYTMVAPKDRAPVALVGPENEPLYGAGGSEPA
ncbi:MAG: efflux RND transporter permease subunit [Deferrisomatales bacterium]